jgi:hypothetical protein
MSNIQNEVNKCIETDSGNQQKFEEISIKSAMTCAKLGKEFLNKFFPDGDETIKISEKFAYGEEFSIILFREASLWWNAQKTKFPLGNHYYDDGAIPFGNLLINKYICTQIKNLETGIEENGIKVGQLEIHDHLDIPADEILNRDISDILKMGTDIDLPDIVVPDATNVTGGNVFDKEKDIIEQKIPEEDDENNPGWDQEISECEINRMLLSLGPLEPGQKITYKGKTITILAPVEK